uniref:Uncharacterized protein n=1 Tax=Schistocephalus solidus TaxID=70667 RepID=A0A0X3PDH4_SCHSO
MGGGDKVMLRLGHWPLLGVCCIFQIHLMILIVHVKAKLPRCLCLSFAPSECLFKRTFKFLAGPAESILADFSSTSILPTLHARTTAAFCLASRLSILVLTPVDIF